MQIDERANIAEPNKTNSRYLISKRQTTNERGGGERCETIFNIGNKLKKIKHNGKSGLGGGERVGKRSAEEKP